ncbi:MAG TPA: hypothetical protein VHC71_04295 [Hyphomicrobium sp.]|jgi:hypothetical protein|nr:hypothetical protein [Hyphomicrobium sp.]
MLLFTSIPPKFSRKGRGGEEIGDKYLRACVASWKDNGFEPISINRPDEIEAVAELGLTGTIPAKMNEAFFPNRYGPPLADLFDSLPKNEQVAYVNADIFMLRGNLADSLREKHDDALVMARRSDLDFLGAGACETFELGLDFFCFNPSRLRNVMADPNIRRFQIGAPWWDYVFPLACMTSTRPLTLHEPIIVHQLHPDRWDPSIWNELGIHAGRALAKYFPEPFQYILDHISDYKSPAQIFATATQIRLFNGSNVLQVPLQPCDYFPTIPTNFAAPTKVPKMVPQTSSEKDFYYRKRRSWPRSATHAVRDYLRVFRRITGLP